MLCAVCNKESANRRVCPYCFTPYPAEGSQSRASTATGRASAGGPAPAAPLSLGPLEPVRAWFARQTPVVRFSAVGIVVMGLVWLFTGGEELPATKAPVAVPAEVTAAPLTREEALDLIKRTRESALVEEQADEVTVSYPAATFPVESAGQIRLASQFARADETVTGRKRRIYFHTPSGRMFAQSDAVTGLTVVK